MTVTVLPPGWLQDDDGQPLAKIDTITAADGVALTTILTDNPMSVGVAFMSRAEAVRLGRALVALNV